MQGLIIAAQASGCGKTTAALGLISALASRNIPVAAAKTGPDFIDTAWLAKISGRPALNLDPWMASEPEELCQAVRSFAAGSFLVVEGAMGLYDGDGCCSSAARLAELLSLPILLVLNVKGMGQSVAALAEGFLAYRPDWSRQTGMSQFCGVICSHTGSERHSQLVKEAIEPVCAKFSVPFLGCLGRHNAPVIPARHLGLIQAQEMDLDANMTAEWFKAGCNLDSLCQAIQIFPSVARKKFKVQIGPIIAIARDEAFTFCYADFPDLLASLGARCVFFSPLHDKDIPRCDGIYLPGGYPELYARELCANDSMRRALRAHANRPVYAECGGYVYLMQSLEDLQGRIWKMAGLLPGHSFFQKKSPVLGYRKARSLLFPGVEARGHEFHYAVETASTVSSLWEIADSADRPLGMQGQMRGNVTASWIHLYPLGSREFWRRWLELCMKGRGDGQD